MNHDHRLILIAVIGKAQGLSGQMRLKSFNSDAEALAHYTFFYDKTGKEYRVAKLQFHKNIPIISLQGVNSRTQAEQMAGVELFVTREQLPAVLDDDEFYQQDLLGFAVFDEHKQHIGEISGFFNFGAGDLLEITLLPNMSAAADTQSSAETKLQKGKRKAAHGVKIRKELIPFSKAAVPQLILAKRMICIDSLAAGLVAETEQPSETLRQPLEAKITAISKNKM